eukprot:14687022-Ditylum_brightwellii.AAC.1
MNDISQEEKDLWPYTCHWYFVPFNLAGPVMQEQIQQMMEAQNYFLETQINVVVLGFEDIEFHIPDPDTTLMENDPCMEG